MYPLVQLARLSVRKRIDGTDQLEDSAGALEPLRGTTLATYTLRPIVHFLPTARALCGKNIEDFYASKQGGTLGDQNAIAVYCAHPLLSLGAGAGHANFLGAAGVDQRADVQGALRRALCKHGGQFNPARGDEPRA